MNVRRKGSNKHTFRTKNDFELCGPEFESDHEIELERARNAVVPMANVFSTVPVRWKSLCTSNNVFPISPLLIRPRDLWPLFLAEVARRKTSSRLTKGKPCFASIPMYLTPHCPMLQIRVHPPRGKIPLILGNVLSPKRTLNILILQLDIATLLLLNQTPSPNSWHAEWERPCSFSQLSSPHLPVFRLPISDLI